MLGVAVTNNGRVLNIRARKAVIIGTGGSSGNVNFRRMFDPRLTEEYCGLAGMPWSNQDASGELAGMAIGASLWGAANYTLEIGDNITKPGKIGAQYIYSNLTWMPGSRVFDKAGASGLRVTDYQNLIHVNMLGQRFYDETGANIPATATTRFSPISPTARRTPRTSNSILPIGFRRRWPASAMGKMAAVRSGRFSMPTRPRAKMEHRLSLGRHQERLLLQREHAWRARVRD